MAIVAIDHITEENARNQSVEYFMGNVLAANSFIKKYALRDKNNNLHEHTPDDMHLRLAKEFNRIDLRFAKDNINATIYSVEEYMDALKCFARIVPQGSPMSAIGNIYSKISASNCFVIDAASFGDSISGIFSTINEAAEIMKRRGGVGIDISVYRPSNTTVNNSASSSTGVVSICEAISFFGRYIGQQGRQGALMITIGDRHPDVFSFAKMKEDLSKVTGANVSIRVSRELVEAARNNEDWELRWPLTGEPKVVKTVKAKDLWDLMIEQAWSNGEPGLLFWDNYCENLPAHCYKEEGFETITTNPCSEIGLSGYDSCRLISQNLVGYVKNPHVRSAYFDFDAYKKDIRMAMQMEDNLVELEIEIIDEIINDLESDEDEKKLPYSVQKNLWNKIKSAAINGRRTGLGTHGLADALISMMYKYSDGVEVVDRIYSTLRNEAYRKSIDLAKERGAFPVFDWGKEKDCAFIKRLPEDIRNDMAIYGRRNISLLTGAPTGTTALLSKTSGIRYGVSSGIEPVYEYAYVRRVKITSDIDLEAHFVDQNGDKWHHYPVIHSELLEWAEVNGKDVKAIEKALIENSVSSTSDATADEVLEKLLGGLPPQWQVTSKNLKVSDRLKIISTIQKYIDHGLSQTANFPKGTPKEEVENFYKKASDYGLKGVTVYVDGSRSGVIIPKTEPKKSINLERPDSIECNIHRSNGHIVLVGLNNGEVHEVFAGKKEDLPVPEGINKAEIRKIESGVYACVFKVTLHNRKVAEHVCPIKESFIKDEGMTVRLLTNLAIRSGASLETICHTIFKSADINSFSRHVARVLSNYIKDAKHSEGCCEDPHIRYEDGCKKCLSCGWSKCN